MTAVDFAAPEPERELVAPVFRDSLVTVYQADCLDLLPTMPASSVTSDRSALRPGVHGPCLGQALEG